MISNENDFLGLIIKCKNSNDTCSIGKILNESGMTDVQCLAFLKSLSNKGILTKIDLETYLINPIAYSVYQSPTKKITKSFYNFTKFSLQRVVDILVGVAIGIIVACVAHHFGWQ